MTVSAHAGRILGLAILAGLIAGGIMAAANRALLWPYLSVVSDAIIDEQLAGGEYDQEEFELGLASAQAAQSWGSLAMGIGAGVIIGAVQVFSKPGTNNVIKAVTIAALSWFVLFVVPTVKYPASPLAMFDDIAAGSYYPLYYGYMAVSGLAAVGSLLAFRKVNAANKMLGAGAVYLVVVAIAYMVFPAYDKDAIFDQRTLNTWRALTSLSTAILWFSTGAISGSLWKYGVPKKVVDGR